MTTPRIKIYVSCHKNFHVPNNKYIFPIQVGTALSYEKLKGMLYDNSGDNISDKNKSYCELTAQYWAWKNDDADYYGFFHYRRYFSFNKTKFETNPFGEVVETYNDDATMEKYNIDEKTIAEVVPKYDLIIPTTGGFEDGSSIYQQYKQAPQHIISDLDFVLDVIKRDYPQMYKYAVSYLKSKKGYFCNMFIMKKELFNQYNEWLFDILKKHEENVDISHYGIQQYRVHGYLAERLCGVYISYLLHTQKLKVLKLQRVFFQKPEGIDNILPAFKQNNVAVVFSANDFYVPYLSALLQSVKQNSNLQHNYDILVLTNDISKDNQALLSKQLAADNFSLRFVDVGRLMRSYRNLPLRGHFRIETYFRILLPEMLPQYDKILYLDSDMIVCDDVAKLYNEDVEGYLLAACLDADSAGLYNGYEPNKKYYIDNVLKLKEPYKYFQAGTILFNLKEFRKTYTVDQMMKFASSYQWELLDQDVLNYLAQGKAKFVDMAWNVMMDWRGKRIRDIISLAPRDLAAQYMQARKAPKVIHYAGPDKPWDFPISDFAWEFWQYARQTPYYEYMVYRNRDHALHHLVGKKTSFAQKLYKIPMVRWFVNKMYPKNSQRREKLKARLKI